MAMPARALRSEPPTPASDAPPGQTEARRWFARALSWENRLDELRSEASRERTVADSDTDP